MIGHFWSMCTDREAWFTLPLNLVLFMVINATFNNISAISWWSVLLVHETRVPGENQTTNLPKVTDKLYHIILY